MTKRPEDSAFQLDLPELGSAINTEAMTKMARSALTSMAEFNGQLFERAAALNVEWTKFLSRRFKEDMALPERLTASKSAQEAQDIYVDFWTTTLKEYQEEFVRLAQMGQHVTREAASNMQKCANVVTHEARPN
jgi:hypothetical protein